MPMIRRVVDLCHTRRTGDSKAPGLVFPGRHSTRARYPRLTAISLLIALPSQLRDRMIVRVVNSTVSRLYWLSLCGAGCYRFAGSAAAQTSQIGATRSRGIRVPQGRA